MGVIVSDDTITYNSIYNIETYHKQNNHVRVWAGRGHSQQLSVSCHRCFISRHRSVTAANSFGSGLSVCAQQTTAADIISIAAAWTDMAMITSTTRAANLRIDLRVRVVNSISLKSTWTSRVGSTRL